MEISRQMDRVEALEAHRNARRKDRGLSSFDYAEGAIKRGGFTVLLGVFGFLLGEAVNPDLIWAFLLPATAGAIITAQSFRLTYLDRLADRRVSEVES